MATLAVAMAWQRGLSALLLAAALLVPAAFAWACVPQATLSAQPGSGPAGTQVTVSGQQWAERPIEIRWDGTSGPLLAEVEGPSFSTTVTVPQVADGDYTLIARQQFPDHVWVERTPFQVASQTAPPPNVGPPPGVAPPPPAQRRTRSGRCSKLKGKRRAVCVKRRCGKLRGAKRRACVKRATRRAPAREVSQLPEVAGPWGSSTVRG